MNSCAPIALDRATFQYAGKDDAVIRGIDLDIHEGEFVVLTGRSGCGKTTVARLVNGLVPHFHEGTLDGTVSVDGLDTRDLSIGDIGKVVGSVFQDPRSQFFMTDTTSEVAFGCMNAGLPQAVVLERVNSAFQRMGIQHLRDRSVFTLSSGEMQMVAIASCYAMDPSVYVFDEPSANLDIAAVKTLKRAMSKLKREGKTVVVLEHRLFYLSDLIDRLVVIEDGAVAKTYERPASRPSRINRWPAWDSEAYSCNQHCEPFPSMTLPYQRARWRSSRPRSLLSRTAHVIR
ncbi:ABC transporter ATP-binding protein [Trueperella pyogenes]